MKSARWLVVTGLLLAGLVVPLGRPGVALADSTGFGPVVVIAGEVQNCPDAGQVGDWTVDGTEFRVEARTMIVQAWGKAEEGASVVVMAKRSDNGTLQAFLMRTLPPVQAGQLRTAITRVQATMRVAERARSEVQAQLQAKTHAQGQGQLHAQQQVHTQQQTQTQQQNQAGIGEQEQTRDRQQLQDGTCTQDQTQQQLQDGTCTQDQTQQQLQDGTGAQGPAQGQGRGLQGR